MGASVRGVRSTTDHGRLRADGRVRCVSGAGQLRPPWPHRGTATLSRTRRASAVRGLRREARASSFRGNGSPMPQIELGPRHDGGDAGTGAGVEDGFELTQGDPGVAAPDG